MGMDTIFESRDEHSHIDLSLGAMTRCDKSRTERDKWEVIKKEEYK